MWVWGGGRYRGERAGGAWACFNTTPAARFYPKAILRSRWRSKKGSEKKKHRRRPQGGADPDWRSSQNDHESYALDFTRRYHHNKNTTSTARCYPRGIMQRGRCLFEQGRKKKKKRMPKRGRIHIGCFNKIKVHVLDFTSRYHHLHEHHNGHDHRQELE